MANITHVTQRPLEIRYGITVKVLISTDRPGSDRICVMLMVALIDAGVNVSAIHLTGTLFIVCGKTHYSISVSFYLLSRIPI